MRVYFLGIIDRTDEVILVVLEGIVKARGIRRQVKETRWDTAQVLSIQRTALRPNDRPTDVRIKTFIQLGRQKYTTVCILGFNSPEWIISNVAAIFAGGFATGIYPTNGPDACKYILEHSRCSILVVEDQKQLDKIWNINHVKRNNTQLTCMTGHTHGRDGIKA